jgi:hypothetical protein
MSGCGALAGSPPPLVLLEQAADPMVAIAAIALVRCRALMRMGTVDFIIPSFLRLFVFKATVS